MLDFIYDSLETVKKLTFPTKKEFISLFIGVFVIVILAWIFFIIIDWFFRGAYETFYNILRW